MSNRLAWPVVPQIQVRRERWPGGRAWRLPTPLVAPGQSVSPDQPVLRFEGAGQVETIPAGLRGRVVEITARGGVVIECRAAVVQGALGAGRQVAGTLMMWRDALVGEAARGEKSGKLAIPPGALLVVPGPVNFAMLRQASISGVVGLIASSVPLRDLEGFLQTDVVQLVNSRDSEKVQENLPAMVLLFTEGSGNIAMPESTMNLLSHYEGSIALLSGETSVRQQVLPELVIALPPQEAEQHWQPQRPATTIQVGSRVRVWGGDYAGVTGEVDYLFAHQQLFSSGIRARAARVRRADGTPQVLPLSMLERIG